MRHVNIKQQSEVNAYLYFVAKFDTQRICILQISQNIAMGIFYGWYLLDACVVQQ